MDDVLLLRALEIYEQYRIHFPESYLAACAELSGVGAVASCDGDIVTPVLTRKCGTVCRAR